MLCSLSDVAYVSERSVCLGISFRSESAYPYGIVPLAAVRDVVVSSCGFDYIASSQVEHHVIAEADDIAFLQIRHVGFAELREQRRVIIASSRVIIIGASSLAYLQHGLLVASMSECRMDERIAAV